MSEQPRYVVAEGWGHIFSPEFGEETTRWVYDRQENQLIGAEIAVRNVMEQGEDGRFRLKSGWREAGDAERQEMQDSVIIANSDCLETPDDWDLEETDDLPDWVPQASPAPGI